MRFKWLYILPRLRYQVVLQMGLIQKYSQTLTNQAWEQKNLCRLSHTCEDKPQHMEHNTKVIVYFFLLSCLSKYTRPWWYCILGFLEGFHHSEFLHAAFPCWLVYLMPTQHYFCETKLKDTKYSCGNPCQGQWVWNELTQVSPNERYRSPLVQGHWGDFQHALMQKSSLNTEHLSWMGESCLFPSWTGCHEALR